MHELSIACHLVDMAESVARSHHASRVVAVACRVGATRQVDVNALTDSFAMARVGTSVDKAHLRVSTVGMTLKCADCDHKETLQTWSFECPRCGSQNIQLSGGDELELTSVELEVPDDRSDRAQECLNE